MNILIGDEWVGGFLDPWCAPGELRIEVTRWVVVAELNDLFVESRYDIRRLIDYGREVGPVEVARKVMSRLSESNRNEKFAACGEGVVLGGQDDRVRFFAPCAPRGVGRVVLPPELVWRASATVDPVECDFEPWLGWSRESGVPLGDVGALEAMVAAVLAGPDVHDVPQDSSPVTERRGEPIEGRRLKASCFGYGHYVRSLVLASLPAEIEVVTVHELDPVLAPDSFPAVDTAPLFREDEQPDVTFVAGYHHTHAPLAAEALRRGSWVISEKPLATTAAQLDELLDEIDEPSRYFAGFQRRYMAANGWIRADLEPGVDDPLSYHALVHEISLPARHWYRWPVSGSRLLSNGCHWIDHFLWLNQFAEVADIAARRGPNDELVCEITLDNGAYFTMTLTDRGSDRLGVREHTELRVRDRTAVIEDMKSYVCEGPRGVLRRETFHKLAAHHQMYETFARRILACEPGDDRSGIERTARTVLELEARLSR